MKHGLDSSLIDDLNPEKKMTKYGTIPTEPWVPPSPNPDYISRAKQHIETALATSRPWKEMIQGLDINLPTTTVELVTRTKINLLYFRTNYAIATLFIVILSLLWHPVSLVIFVSVIVTWFFVYYFLRNEPPLILYGCEIKYRELAAGLVIATMVALFLARVVENIVAALLMSATGACIHGVLRRTEDLFFVVEEEGLNVV